MSDKKLTNLTLRSTVHPPAEGKRPFVELSLLSETVPTPKADEVIIRVEATPLNPSDLYLLLPTHHATEIPKSVVSKDSAGRPTLRADIPDQYFQGLKPRVSTPLPVGNEGAGTVVDAGSSAEAQRLIGKTVAVLGGAMYSQYRCVKASQCLELSPGTTAREGASCFVNPLTVLGMLETMKMENFKGLVHTAAASQLGQMLVKACNADGIPLVNVVRKADQEELLKSLGAKYIVNSSSPTFQDDLEKAIQATNAFLAFDATGGGSLASIILNAMEKAANKNMTS